MTLSRTSLKLGVVGLAVVWVVMLVAVGTPSAAVSGQEPSTPLPITPQDPATALFSWTTCGACPGTPEVTVTGDTIRMGVYQRGEHAYQSPGVHGAATLLPAAGQYRIAFTYDLYSWDSYIALTELGRGYWDAFTVSVASQPLWQTLPADPVTTQTTPGLGFLWGGARWGDGVLKHVSGSDSVVVVGNAGGANYLTVALNTLADPQSDNLFPSWGTITITGVTAESDLGTLGELAAANARSVVGGDYLWGGKGWNWQAPKEYVATQKVFDGYYYYKAASGSIEWGAGLDCSGLVYWAYDKASGATKYPGSPIYSEGAQEQKDNNTTPFSGKENLKPGDLLFFGPSAKAITHVAMFVGGNNPAQNVVEAASPGVGIKYSSLDARVDGNPLFQGFGRVKFDQPALKVQTNSPISLIVTDPDGFTVTGETYVATEEEYIRGVPGHLYYTTDENGDDLVYAPVLKSGIYTIKVMPKSDALPGDTYGLEVLGGGKLIDLAQDEPVSEIPPQGYQIIAVDGEINVAAQRVYLPAAMLQPTPTPTDTPTATFTPSPTATRPRPPEPPTATPTVPACGNAIANASFEENAAWQINSNEFPAAYWWGFARSGNRSMRVGIPTAAENRYSYSSAQQTVTIPSPLAAARLGYWLYPQTTGTVAALTPPPVVPTSSLDRVKLSDDAQMVLLYDRNGHQHVLTFQRENPGRWLWYEHDLSAFRGQTVTLYFGVYNNGWGGVTAMWVDDVALATCP